MKAIIFILVYCNCLVQFCSAPTFAKNIEIVYLKKIMFSIPYGNEDNQIGIAPAKPGASAGGPEIYYIEDDEFLYIGDLCNSRIKKFNSSNQLVFQTPKLDTITDFYIDNSNLIHVKTGFNLEFFDQFGKSVDIQNYHEVQSVKGVVTFRRRKLELTYENSKFPPIPNNLLNNNKLKSMKLDQFSIAYAFTDKAGFNYLVNWEKRTNPIVLMPNLEIRSDVVLSILGKDYTLVKKIKYPSIPGFGHRFDYAKVDLDGNIYHLEFLSNKMNVIKLQRGN